MILDIALLIVGTIAIATGYTKALSQRSFRSLVMSAVASQDLRRRIGTPANGMV